MLAIGVTVFFALVEKVENPAVVIIHEPDTSYVNVSLESPLPLAFLRIDNPRSAMTPHGFFLVGERGGETVRYSLKRASAVTPLAPFFRADAVMIAEHADDKGRLWLDGAREVSVYARRIHWPTGDR